MTSDCKPWSCEPSVRTLSVQGFQNTIRRINDDP